VGLQYKLQVNGNCSNNLWLPSISSY